MVLSMTQTLDGRIIMQNECDDRLGSWIIPSFETLSWLIYEETAEDTPLRIYQPPLNSIVLVRSQVIARTCEVKT
jgi:hypothetical protein